MPFSTKYREKYIKRMILSFILLISLSSLLPHRVSSHPHFTFTLFITNNNVEGLLPVMKISNYSTLVFSNYCDLGFSAFEKNEKRVLINLSSPLSIILHLINNMHVHPDQIFISNSSCPLSAYYLAGLSDSVIVNIGRNVSYKDFLKELKQHGIRGIKTCGSIKNIEIQNSNRLVVTFKDDALSRLAAVYAGISNAHFLVAEDLNSIRDAIKRYNVTSVVYVISSKNLIKMGLAELYKPVIEAYSDRFFHVNVGIISGYSDSCAVNFASRSLYYLAKGVNVQSALLAYMEDAELLAEKIIRELDRSGVSIYQKLVSFNEHGNLTRESLIDSLKQASGIVFINLHGNPYGMARTTTGPYVVTAHSLEEVNSRNIIVTLSCLTCNFNEILNPKNSIALAFISKGALAYIGARKVEYAGELETSTAFPELITYMLLRGYSLGSAVRWVNNIHIRAASGVDPWIAAYTCLLGDPDLRLSNATGQEDASVKLNENEISVNILRETCCVTSRIEFPYAAEEVKFELKNPDVRRVLFITKEGDKYILNIFLTKKISKDVGDFKPGDVVIIKYYKKLSVIDLLPYAAATFIAFLAVILYVKRRKRKILRPDSS